MGNKHILLPEKKIASSDNKFHFGLVFGLLKNSNKELLDEFLTAICSSTNKLDVRNTRKKKNNDYVTEKSNEVIACSPSPSIMWNVKSGELANKEIYHYVSNKLFVNNFVNSIASSL